MTNNQRFAAELVVLLAVGTAIWAKADVKQPATTTVQPSIVTRQVMIVDADGHPRAILTSSGLTLLDKKPLIGDTGKVTAHFGDPVDGRSDGATLEIMGKDNMSSIALGEYTIKDRDEMVLSLGAPLSSLPFPDATAAGKSDFPNGVVNIVANGTMSRAGEIRMTAGTGKDAYIKTFDDGSSEVRAASFLSTRKQPRK